MIDFIPKTAFGDDSEEDPDMLSQEPELDDQQPQDTGHRNSADDPPSAEGYSLSHNGNSSEILGMCPSVFERRKRGIGSKTIAGTA